jgi:hypothetical protein
VNEVRVMMKCAVRGCPRPIVGALQRYMDATDHDGQDEVLEVFKHGWCKHHDRIVRQRYPGRIRPFTLEECLR